jgi:hypothetical protein
VLNRTGALVAVGFVGVLLVAMMTVVIVTNDERVTTTAGTRRPARTATTANFCKDDVVSQDDDIPAQQALLNESQLPSGDWTSKSASLCRWSISGQDLLSISECTAIVADAEGLEEERTGNARAAWVRAGGAVLLDDRAELYPSRRKPAAVQALFTGPGLSDCLEAAMRQQAAKAPSVKIVEIEVSSYEVGLDAAELGVGFVDGVSISMKVESNGQSRRVAVRVVSFVLGGGLGTVTVTGTAPAGERPDLDAIDLAASVRAAAKNFIAIF